MTRPISTSLLLGDSRMLDIHDGEGSGPAAVAGLSWSLDFGADGTKQPSGLLLGWGRIITGVFLLQQG